ncbi:JmjC domain-containing protein [Pandoraea anhela]|uniref:50S ribosomal protein L16 3-hydroxylase n=1 Tax=Pandoraea anhela TaxID=2508295 RepID=A0A5E4Z1Z0_9BURK|nr:cupin domain-containing protein [Pandoraea anhela]VVE55164.1 50S ribosomal protein L16 3-hydroxylase [Pandoraea anhela]
MPSNKRCHLNLKTVANGYAAFGGKGTFGRHWDTHDVVAIQLMGRKKWKVFPPTLPNPLDHQKSKYRKDECPDEAFHELVLEQGDALYIPRGWWHEATPIAGQETFHIAVGLHTAKVADYLAWIASQILPSLEPARRSFYPFNDDSQAMINIAESIREEILKKDNRDLFLKEVFNLNNKFKEVDFGKISSRSLK